MSVKKDFDNSRWQRRPIRIVKISEKILFFQEVEVRTLSLDNIFPVQKLKVKMKVKVRRHVYIQSSYKPILGPSK